MRNGFLLGVAVTIIVFGGLTVAYNSDVVSKLTQDRITWLSSECLKIHKSNFRDPNSAYVSGARFSVIDDNILLVEVRAKNGFGGYVTADIECHVNGDVVTRN